MKKILSITVLLTCLSALSAFGSERVGAKTWSGVQTVDVATLKKNLDSFHGTIIGMRFHFRGKDIRHAKPSWYQSAIWQRDPQNKKGFSDVQVMVAKKDLAAFKSITTDSQSAELLTVYGQVLHDQEAPKWVFVRLLGRNAAVDAKGDATISW
ncbi:MAG: hypothetical protein QOI04_1232 [Verrucomicrobiota bacterium]|jgi:hypothetical protein